MSVLGRMSMGLILAGLLTGVVLRIVLGRRRMATVALGFVAVPLLLHMGYIAVQSLGHGAGVWGLVAYLAASAAMGTLGALAVRRSIEHHRWRVALIPGLTGIVYAAVPFGLYSLALRQQAIDFDVVPTALYLAAALFATAVLVVFAPAGPGALLEWARSRRR